MHLIWAFITPLWMFLNVFRAFTLYVCVKFQFKTFVYIIEIPNQYQKSIFPRNTSFGNKNSVIKCWKYKNITRKTIWILFILYLQIYNSTLHKYFITDNRLKCIFSQWNRTSDNRDSSCVLYNITLLQMT